MTTRFDTMLLAIREAQRDAEKEATRLEITQPDLADEARTRADGLTDARNVIETIGGLAKTLAALQSTKEG